MRRVSDPKRLREQLRDPIPVAFAEARGDIERWLKATEVLVVEEAHRTSGLGQSEVRAIGRELATTQHMLPSSSTAETITQALTASSTA